MTEAGPNGELVCKVQLLQTAVSGQFTRMTWPLETLSIPVTKRELAEGNTYVFTDGSKVTGVEMLVTSLDGDIYNDVTVTREPFAPVLPRFQGQSPRVQRVRLIINPPC